MRPLFSYGLSLLLAATLLSGCQSVGGQKRDELLTETLRAYSSTIRWGDLRHAYGYLRPEQAEKAEIPPGLDNIRVTHYEVVDPLRMMGENGASQVVQIRYIQQDRQMEKELTDRQLWEFEEEAKRWYLISKVPPFVPQPQMRILPLGK
jgi:hypothetical protein